MACSSRSPDNAQESLSTLMEKLIVSPITVGSHVWIEVTHINNPNSFYVRPTVYNHYLPTLQAHGSQIGLDDLFIGNNIVFKSNIHNLYIRGQILYIDEEDVDTKLELFAMDYGHIERAIPLDSVYKPLHHNCVPSSVKHCQLELCKPPKNDIWTSKSIEAMKYFIGDERTKIIIQDMKDDLLTVTMYNSCPEDISTMLALTGYSVLGYDKNAINRFSTPKPAQLFYLFQELKIDDTIKVRLMSGKSLKEFYVAEVNSHKKYLEGRENVAYFARQASAIRPEDLCKGKPVCVPTSRHYSYERAIIKEVDEPKGKALVQLVDWGETMQVPLDHIKPIRESFLTIAAIAIYCQVDDSQIWDNKLLKFLYPGYTFIIKIKEIGESHESPNIVILSEVTKSKSAR